MALMEPTTTCQARPPRAGWSRRAATLLVCLPVLALAQEAGFSGQVHSYWIERDSAGAGPLAAANALQPGTALADPSTATLQAELKSNTKLGTVSLQGSVLLQAQQAQGDDPTAATLSRVNEAYAAGQALGWQWSAGKKVVSWDVGYGFRPNDLVQQETRRILAPEILEGRPLAMAEYFNADTAWSLVWVNPTAAQSATGAQEAAVDARLYWRQGAVDWHGFARQGDHTGTSLGAAFSWVASEAVELHASVRAYERADSIRSNVSGSTLSTSNPWLPTTLGAGQQWLVGGTWTNASQVSLLLEAWHDDTALTDAQWSAWNTRNQGLPQWLQRRVPATAVAGNLAWQANAFGASTNLRQDNVFARLSWQYERWQTALDMLYAPADQGTMTTTSVVWTGEHVKLEGGVRTYGGPQNAVVRQLPTQRQAYAMATWAF